MVTDSTLGELLLAVGAPLLVGLYFLEGLLIGKLLHPSILFILYVVVSDPSFVVTVLVAALCVVSSTAGQVMLYRGFNEEIDEREQLIWRVPYLERVPAMVKDRIGTRRMKVINRQFDRFGGNAIWLSNAIPGFRGLMTVVAGLSGYPQRRFILLSTLGNVIYMLILIAVATGLLEAIRFIPWDLSPETFLRSS